MKKKTSKKKARVIYTNRNAFIENRVSSTGSFRTETAGRDEGSLEAQVSTDPTSNRTSLRIFRDGMSLKLSGREARTIYRVLQRHYDYTGKAVVEAGSESYDSGYLF